MQRLPRQHPSLGRTPPSSCDPLNTALSPIKQLHNYPYSLISRSWAGAQVVAMMHARDDPNQKPRKTVAIIGGGMASLASAKAAVEVGLLPTIFERRPAVGGMWADRAATYDSLHTNVSRFTCSFSDFPWPSGSPDFPSAGEVGKYLSAYHRAFLTKDNCRLQLGCEVLRVEPNPPSPPPSAHASGGGGSPSWSVHWRAADPPAGSSRAASSAAARDTRGLQTPAPPPPQPQRPRQKEEEDKGKTGGERKEREAASSCLSRWERTDPSDGNDADAAVVVMSQRFDFVVVASGFCAVPYVPAIPGLDAFPGFVLHSAAYTGAHCVAGRRRVVVVGSGHSAADITADLAAAALRAAAAAAPAPPAAAAVDPSLDVVHVTPRPFWIIPRYLPLEAAAATAGGGASPFVPLDLFLHRWSARLARGPGPQELVFPSGEDNAKVNAWFTSLCGNQGKMLSPLLSIQPDSPEPPTSSISDSYVPLLVSGRIQLRLGRLHRVSGFSLELAIDESSGASPPPPLQPSSVLHDVDAIVLCTGLRPALPFLPEDLLNKLSYDEHDNYVPLVLHRRVLHPDVPGLAFVGLFRSPFFAVVELQARLAMAAFTGTLPAEEMDPAVQYASVAQELRVRHHAPRPPYPHQDFVGHADGLAAALGVLPPGGWRMEHDVVVAAHYAAFSRPMQPPPPPMPTLRAASSAAASATAVMATAVTATAAACDDAAAVKGQVDVGVAAAATAAEGSEWEGLSTASAVLPAATEGVRQALADVAAAMQMYRRGRRVASAVFYALAGEWAFSRRIISRLASSPSGEVTGRACFTTIADADYTPAVGGAGGLSYLYDEQGQFAVRGGAVMRVRREYVYVYDSTGDRIDVYFAEGGARRGGFFHSLRFLPPGEPPEVAAARDAAVTAAATAVEPRLPSTLDSDGGDGGGPQIPYTMTTGTAVATAAGSTADAAASGAAAPDAGAARGSGGDGGVGDGGGGGWRAVGEHLCGRDMYNASYKFFFEGIQLREFEIEFRVKGPNKDYTATATYTRP